MKNYLRDDLIKLKPYKVIEKNIRHKMDANESPLDMPKLIREILAQELANGISLNRYPDSNAFYLREAIGDYVQMSPSQIIVGSGSDELIQMIATAFVDKGDYVIYRLLPLVCIKFQPLLLVEIPLKFP